MQHMIDTRIRQMDTRIRQTDTRIRSIDVRIRCIVLAQSLALQRAFFENHHCLHRYSSILLR